ncbi:Sugar kinase of the NBD/HSP70 family, may contain an N-terminal HTH domain [[Eubacterium] yurii]|nr:Sugar kinase of the NBD/HSP70 family, may contain an N-terminal HTH domain [[Eubacterium] yurii]
MKKYICIDIGGTAIKYGIINEEGEFIDKQNIPSNAQKGGAHLITVVKDIISSYLTKHDNIAGVAMSTAGMVDTQKGEIVYAGKQIPDYIGTNWKKIIRDDFSLPCEIDNDVNCAGLAEAVSGSGKDRDFVLCLTIGTGIGACFTQAQKIYHGHSYSAFEVGYMKLPGGDFQDLASTTALIENFRQKTGDNTSNVNGKIIFELAKKGDENAISSIDEMVDNLCMGIANLCYAVNPNIVVLGGGIMAQRDYLLEKIRKSMQKFLLKNICDKTIFETAYYNNDAGMLGAYYNFIQKTK